MATHADVEMLNRSMQNLGDSFVQKRQEKRQTGLDAEARQQREFNNTRTTTQDTERARERELMLQMQKDRAVQEGQYKSGMLEVARDKAASAKAKALSDAAVKNLTDYKKQMGEFVASIGEARNANLADPNTGFSQEEATNIFVNHLDDLAESDPDTAKKLVADPQMKMMITGKFPWERAARSVGSARVQTFKDPATGQEQSAIVAPHKSGDSVHPFAQPKPTTTETVQTRQVPNPNGGTNAPITLTNRTTKASAPFPTAAAQPAAPSNIPPAHIQYLKAHPEKRASFEATYGKAAAAQILGE